MRKFKGSVSTNYVGCKNTFEFEVDDDATDEEIQEIALECMWEDLDFYYEEIKD